MSFGVTGSGNGVLEDTDYGCVNGRSFDRRPDESGLGFTVKKG